MKRGSTPYKLLENSWITSLSLEKIYSHGKILVSNRLVHLQVVNADFKVRAQIKGNQNALIVNDDGSLYPIAPYSFIVFVNDQTLIIRR